MVTLQQTKSGMFAAPLAVPELYLRNRKHCLEDDISGTSSICTFKKSIIDVIIVLFKGQQAVGSVTLVTLIAVGSVTLVTIIAQDRVENAWQHYNVVTMVT